MAAKDRGRLPPRNPGFGLALSKYRQWRSHYLVRFVRTEYWNASDNIPICIMQ